MKAGCTAATALHTIARAASYRTVLQTPYEVRYDAALRSERGAQLHSVVALSFFTKCCCCFPVLKTLPTDACDGCKRSLLTRVVS
jgi:hypothetical protein